MFSLVNYRLELNCCVLVTLEWVFYTYRRVQSGSSTGLPCFYICLEWTKPNIGSGETLACFLCSWQLLSARVRGGVFCLLQCETSPLDATQPSTEVLFKDFALEESCLMTGCIQLYLLPFNILRNNLRLTQLHGHQLQSLISSSSTPRDKNKT